VLIIYAIIDSILTKITKQKKHNLTIGTLESANVILWMFLQKFSLRSWLLGNKITLGIFQQPGILVPFCRHTDMSSRFTLCRYTCDVYYRDMECVRMFSQF